MTPDRPHLLPAGICHVACAMVLATLFIAAHAQQHPGPLLHPKAAAPAARPTATSLVKRGNGQVIAKPGALSGTAWQARSSATSAVVGGPRK